MDLSTATLAMFRDEENQEEIMREIWGCCYKPTPAWSDQYDPRGELDERFEHWSDEA